VNSALLVVDVLTDFDYPDGDKLLASFAGARPALEAALAGSRAAGTPVVYANDNRGLWDGDRNVLVERALAGIGGDLVSGVVPEPGDRFVIKPRYSAFDLTPLELILSSLAIERILLCGTTTEMCVAQTAIAARERNLKVSILVDACAHINEENTRIALAYLERVAGVRLETVAP
jgi:nicotinamidase-related amidase